MKTDRTIGDLRRQRGNKWETLRDRKRLADTVRPGEILWEAAGDLERQ